MSQEECEDLLAASQALARSSHSLQSALEELKRILERLLPEAAGYIVLPKPDPAPAAVVSFGGAPPISDALRAQITLRIRKPPNGAVAAIEPEAREQALALLELDGERLGGALFSFPSAEGARTSLNKLSAVAAVAAVHLSNALRNDAAAETLQYTREYDAMVTQLPNRVLFRRRAAQAIQQGASAAVLFLDLDNFKAINRRFGFAQGDRVLAEVALRWQQFVASEYKNATLARMGGDEFALLLPELRQEAAPGSMAQSLLDALGRPFSIAGVSCVLRASLGISLCPADAHETEALLRRAEQAMFAAKSAGGDRFAYAGEPSPDAGRRA